MKGCQGAFTLLELLVTLAVIGVLAALAAPSFSVMVANNRSVSIAQDLASSMRLARSEAIKRGMRVSICASADGVNCAGDWNNGWIVFPDAATSDVASPLVTSSTRIQHYTSDGRATLSAFRNGVAQTYIRFTNQGLLAHAASNTNPIVINAQYSGCRGESARQIQIGIAGNLTLSKQSCT